MRLQTNEYMIGLDLNLLFRSLFFFLTNSKNNNKCSLGGQGNNGVSFWVSSRQDSI